MSAREQVEPPRLPTADPPDTALRRTLYRYFDTSCASSLTSRVLDTPATRSLSTSPGGRHLVIHGEYVFYKLQAGCFLLMLSTVRNIVLYAERLLEEAAPR